MKVRDRQSYQGGINVKRKNRKAHCLTQHWLPGCVGPTFTMVRKHVYADHIKLLLKFSLKYLGYTIITILTNTQRPEIQSKGSWN